MDKLKLYFRFTSISLKTRLEYKYSFVMSQFIALFTYSITYLGIWVIFNKFDTMNGWSYYEVMFLYSLNLLSYGFSGLFLWVPMKMLGEMVQQGSFDSILIRPLNPFFHMIVKVFNTAFFGNIVLAGIFLGISINKLGMTWSAMTILWFVIFIFGAFLIQCAMFIFGGSLSFWFVNSSEFVNTFIYGVRRFIDYPINLYDTFITVILTFIIPYGFVNFYPAVFFLNKSGDTPFHPILQYGTPLIGLLLFLLAYKIWTIGIKHYESTGS